MFTNGDSFMIRRRRALMHGSNVESAKLIQSGCRAGQAIARGLAPREESPNWAGHGDG